MESKIKLTDELLPLETSNKHIICSDNSDTLKTACDDDHLTDNNHKIAVKKEEETDYKDSTLNSESIKFDKEKKLLTIYVSQVNDKEECEVKLEQYSDGECSYADRGSEQFTDINTETSLSATLPKLNSFEKIVPLYEVEILRQDMKKENPEPEPVVLIIVEKAAFHKRNFVCSVCFKVFPSIQSLNKHKLTHTSEFINNKKNKSKSLRKKRLKFCKKDSIKCNQCDFQTPKPSYMKRHMIIIHSGGKPFKCELCDYRCAKLWNLKTHTMTHSGEKPFVCELCDYKSARLSDFNSHKVNHGGEKAFKCDRCEYSTTRSSDLKYHKKTHSGVKPYSCSVCDLRFLRSYHLKTHKMTHTGEKPFKCELCSYQTARSSDLKRHQIQHAVKVNS